MRRDCIMELIFPQMELLSLYTTSGGRARQSAGPTGLGAKERLERMGA